MRQQRILHSAEQWQHRLAELHCIHHARLIVAVHQRPEQMARRIDRLEELQRRVGAEVGKCSALLLIFEPQHDQQRLLNRRV